MARIQSSATPNPNSLKFTIAGEQFIEAGMESFNTADEANGHDLGRRLFAIPGVVNVFILPQFLTVTKDESASWKKIVPAVEAAIQAALGK